MKMKIWLVALVVFAVCSPASYATCTAAKAARNTATKATVGVGGVCNPKRAVKQNTDIDVRGKR